MLLVLGEKQVDIRKRMDKSFMKILIIGISGAGKSTLARKLAEKINCPLLHLDQIWHQTDYSEDAQKELIAQVESFMTSNDSWIIDGNYGGSLPSRLKEADKVIWLQNGRLSSIWRVIRRSLNFRKDRTSRPEMPDQFTEKFDKDYLEFLKFVWDFPKESQVRIEKSLENYTGEVIILKSQKEKEAFLETIAYK